MDSAGTEPTPPDASEGGTPAAPARHPLTVLAAFFSKRGVSRRTLAAAGLAFCTLAALCYVVHHPGLAGVLGLVGLVLGEVALAPNGEPQPLARGLTLLADLAVAAGFVAAAALDESGVCVLLGLLTLMLFAWLPYLEAVAPPGVNTPARTLWRRPERLAILLVGGILAHPVVPLLLVTVAGAADAWLSLDRMSRIGQPPRKRPAFLDALLGRDGSIQPLLRWGSLLIALLLLVVLPQGEGWRF